DSIGSGLMTGRSGKLDAFAIAGDDRKWHWAEAEIRGGTVIVHSPEVKQPVAVRYAWSMNPSGRNLLYNKEGLPASPFRTDDWSLFDPDAELVEVLKPKKPDGYVPTDWKRPHMTTVPASDIEVADRPADISSTYPTSPPRKKPMEAEEADGLAPEVTDLNAEDVSFSLEAQLPDLDEPFINARPNQRKDGIPVAPLTREHGDRRAILKFAREIAAGDHGEVDSFLLMADGKLIFESYYRRGRANYPHYQMSITKSYTAMVVGRAIQLGHLTMADLDKPVVSFLKEIDQSKLVEGATQITLAEAMNMRSGIRIDQEKARALMKTPALLKGQGQIQAYLANTTPIPSSPSEYKYQGSDPSMTMQVIEAAVPGTARDFIEKELLGKMGITNFAWQNDVSGLPKSAAGSSMRSRDMIKWGMLVMNTGKWNDEQLIPAEFVEKATSKIHTNPQGTSYGYFWWRHDVEINGKTYDCQSGRGAGGQFILMFPEVDLLVVITAHNKGMGKMLKTVPERILPALVKE
ncbi:beta-lactamase family protein, partial [Verrucomicrobiales bacterium]|nr:beta-lactamase family protein [Verrucomicrobiales bacterium]